jgi:AcrR family transcriptional regulator
MNELLSNNEKVCDILKNALDVFAEQGFANTTFQKIADAANITRTALYLHFHSKLDVFNYSIQLFIKDIENNINGECANNELNSIEKLINIMNIIFSKFEENKKLLRVILDYLVNIHKDYESMHYHIKRRSIRFRHLISGIIIDGVARGEIRRVNIKIVNDTFYNFLCAALYELTVYREDNIKHHKEAFEANVYLLCPC